MCSNGIYNIALTVKIETVLLGVDINLVLMK